MGDLFIGAAAGVGAFALILFTLAVIATLACTQCSNCTRTQVAWRPACRHCRRTRAS